MPTEKPQTESSNIFSGAGSSSTDEPEKKESAASKADTSGNDQPENQTKENAVATKAAASKPARKSTAKKAAVIDTTDAGYMFSLKTSYIKCHPGIISIANLITPVNTKKKKGFEVRYGAAFCSPDDVFNKDDGKKISLKRLGNEKTSRVIFVQKKKAYLIRQAIFADLLASGNFPNWARPVIFESLKQSMITEENILARKRTEAARQKYMQLRKKIIKMKNAHLPVPGHRPGHMYVIPNSNLVAIHQEKPNMIGIAKAAIETGQLVQQTGQFLEPATNHAFAPDGLSKTYADKQIASETATDQ